MNVVLTCIITTRATKVEGADPKKNADKRVFSSRWKNPGDIAFYKDIADSEGWGSNPKHTDRFVEKENVFTLGTVNFRLRIQTEHLFQDWGTKFTCRSELDGHRALVKRENRTGNHLSI